ncbi:MAG: hypothetical protein J6T98_05750 [Salinivirgaceae bacterium]|nr:hypothetical protein [Salinivirgaceae bacterium]
MKRYLFAALMATVLVGFSSCSKNEDDEFVGEQAVGTYEAKMTYFIEENKQLTNAGIEEETCVATVTLDGENLQINLDGDIVKIIKIKETSNGFIFDVEDFMVEEDGASFTLTGYKGYQLEDEKTGYHGAYLSEKNKLEFYFELPKDQLYELMVEVMLSDEEFVNGLKDKGYSDKEIYDMSYISAKDTFGKYRLVVDIECTKK